MGEEVNERHAVGPRAADVETGCYEIQTMNDAALTLLYDADCPMCAAEVRFMQRRDKHSRLAFLDITSPSFEPSRFGLTEDDVHARLHAVEADGTVIEGVEVFRRAYGEVGLGWVLAPTSWPVLRPLADAGYRLFARYRVRIGRLFGRRDSDEACVPR